jgi:hypothetical protein
VDVIMSSAMAAMLVGVLERPWNELCALLLAVATAWFVVQCSRPRARRARSARSDRLLSAHATTCAAMLFMLLDSFGAARRSGAALGAMVMDPGQVGSTVQWLVALLFAMALLGYGSWGVGELTLAGVRTSAAAGEQSQRGGGARRTLRLELGGEITMCATMGFMLATMR